MSSKIKMKRTKNYHSQNFNRGNICHCFTGEQINVTEQVGFSSVTRRDFSYRDLCACPVLFSGHKHSPRSAAGDTQGLPKALTAQPRLPRGRLWVAGQGSQGQRPRSGPHIRTVQPSSRAPQGWSAMCLQLTQEREV